MRHPLLKIFSAVLSPVFLGLMLNCSNVTRILDWTEEAGPDKASSKEATRFFQTVRSPGGNPDSHYLLACYYQERGRHQEAQKEFEKVLRIDPNYIKAWNGMGVSYDALKDYDRSAQCYRKALEIDPNLDYVLNNLGYSYLLQGRAEEAVPLLKRAVALKPEEGRYHNNLGLAHAVQGELDLALEEFKLAGDESKAHYNVAQFYHKMGLYSLAQFHYSAALALDPSFTHARMALRAITALARIFEPEPEKKLDETASEPTPRPAAQIEEAPSPLSPNDQKTAPEPPSEEAKAPSYPALTQLPDPPPPPVFAKVEAVEEKHLEQADAPSARAEKTTMAILAEPERAKVEASPLPQTELPRSEISLKGIGIEVSNGNGRTGMARRVSGYLRGKKIEVNRLTNANHFNHARTRIYYRKGYEEAADHLADQLPARNDPEEAKRFDRSDIRIKVLIGKDLLPYDELFKEGKGS